VPLVELPTTIPPKPDRPDIGGADHPMRLVTRELAFEPDAWTPQRATEVAALFDMLAPTWSDRDVPERHDALRDALQRGGPFPGGVCVEVGAGTGSATPDLLAAFDTVVSTDMSVEMLRLFRATSPTMLADAMLWEELDIVQHVFGEHLPLDNYPVLAKLYRDCPGRAAFDAVLRAQPLAITGRGLSGEEQSIDKIRRVLSA